MSTHRADIPPEPTTDLVAERSGQVHAPGAQSTETRVITTEPAGRGEVRVGIPRAYNLSRDRVRWAAIWAGVITTLTSSLLLGLLGLAVSLTADNAGVRGTAQAATIWAVVAMLLAFLLGGYVAGGAAAVFDRRWGALNGALVFAVTLPLVLWLTTTGIGAALGIVANYAAAMAIDPAQLHGFIEGAPSVGAPSLGRETVQTLWIGFAGLLLALAMSMLGGALGTRRSVELPTTNGRGGR
ncbi:MAG: hypothetical protein M3O34_20710 [Chloroflexota bacterium]|nr:hypothetical protein [Chloroflexota bacterium]